MAAAASQPQVPGTPRIISPSPTPSDANLPSKDGYFAPTTRSAARRSPRFSAQPVINEDGVDGEPDSDSDRARSRSRNRDKRAVNGLEGQTQPHTITRRKLPPLAQVNGSATNGHLSPASAVGSYWREFSRSPSPLGLIPIHQEWRTFVHKHEIPRKALHVSIGFLTLGLYAAGYQTTSITPVLMTVFVPIALTDLFRHNYPPFNRFYIRTLGAFMRESEAHDRYNGVIWYLLGAWATLRFFPKDIGIVSVVLLSWCDTAASTFGRLYGRYTPRVRKGKSLAGSIAAFTVGVATALFFWGWFAPRYEMLGSADNTGDNAFAFQGRLALPDQVRSLFGLSMAGATITGSMALSVMSICAGLVASASEAVDIFGWDDNFTIPVLCGVGCWGILRTFGSA